MAFKRLLILGGAALLVAGCSTDVTSPIASVNGSASARSAKSDNKGSNGKGQVTSFTASDSTSCRGSWPISSGVVDSTCANER